MGDILPDAESVFSPEYWAQSDVTHTQHVLKQFRSLSMAKDVKPQVEALAAIGIMHILTGEPLEILAEGTILDDAEDNKYTHPGTALLLDIEQLEKKPLIPDDFIGIMRTEGEITLPALSIIRKSVTVHKAPIPFPANLPGLRIISHKIARTDMKGQPKVQRYHRAFSQGGQQYSRQVGVHVFYPRRNGALGNASPWFWYNPPTGAQCALSEGWATQGLPVTVGETIETNKGLLRVRDAAVCIKGLLATAPARSKHRVRWAHVVPQRSNT